MNLIVPGSQHKSSISSLIQHIYCFALMLYSINRSIGFHSSNDAKYIGKYYEILRNTSRPV